MTELSPQKTAALVTSVDALRHSVDELAQQYEELHEAAQVDRELLAAERRTANNWRAFTATLGILVVTLGLVAWVAVATAWRQEELTQQATCPFYSLILGSYNPESRAEGPDRDKYMAQFDVMWTIYRVLDCDGELTPPPRR